MREILVCFAVKEEATQFKQKAHSIPGVKILLTGIGRRNAETASKAALARQKPSFVFTCGFAGGLNPELTSGAVVCSAESDVQSVVASAGAKPARFHCSERIVTTAAQKRELYQSTGADAVEMESQFIRAVCCEHNIPSATVRVILDTADEDLPLDFNQLMNSRQEMSYARLALALLKTPTTIPALLRLQRQSQAAGHRLAQILGSCVLGVTEFPDGRARV